MTGIFGARHWGLGFLLLLLLLGTLLLVSLQPALATPSAQSSGEGDPVIGKNMFTGAASFENGGPACRACHTIAGIGALGGGALGPDLTGAYAKFGVSMVTWPELFEPMKTIYSEKPLTDEEKSQLVAFFAEAQLAERAPQAVGQLAGLAVVGVVLLLGLSHLVWRRRLKRVRRPMVARHGSRGL